jgi:hypothetical protein
MEKIRKYQRIFLLSFLLGFVYKFSYFGIHEVLCFRPLAKAKLPQKHTFTYKDRDSCWIVLEDSDLLFSGKEISVSRILAWEVRAIFLK